MKEKWIRLTSDDIRQVLAEDEIQKLQTMSIEESIDDIIQQQIDCVADSYRAAFSSKGYAMDIRPHYLPNAYRLYALCIARYYICTRFPNSLNIFLDEPRKDLYTQAMELLKDPYIGVPEPDYSDDPELSSDVDTTFADASITLPYQRILPMTFQFGYVHPYVYDQQINFIK